MGPAPNDEGPEGWCPRGLRGVCGQNPPESQLDDEDDDPESYDDEDEEQDEEDPLVDPLS
ncbi:hypothetical protein [Streptomyces sp. NBC_00443]|uniref:hypothetical protein n=1 Tax=Streptomyces sp. NBC_00443 TaxID=2975743 RepID=UPI002E1E1500